MALLLLCMGETIYVLYRPLNLYMFLPFEATDTLFMIDYIREIPLFPPKDSLPEWVIYNLPDGMWLLSYMLLMEALWGRENTKFRDFFIWVMPSLIIIWEIMQYMEVVAGTWDMNDMLSYIFAIVIFLKITRL